MTPQDWFGVAVRICALYPLVNGVQALVSYLTVRFGGFSRGMLWGQFDEGTSITLLTNGIGSIVVSLVLLRTLPLLVTFAYPLKADEQIDLATK